MQVEFDRPIPPGEGTFDAPLQSDGRAVGRQIQGHDRIALSSADAVDAKGGNPQCRSRRFCGNVSCWHLADSLSRLATCPLLGVKRTSPRNGHGTCPNEAAPFPRTEGGLSRRTASKTKAQSGGGIVQFKSGRDAAEFGQNA